MNDEVRKYINHVLGKGFAEEGASADRAPPDWVAPNADPELAKRALQRLSRHLTLEEITAVINKAPELAQVFNLDQRR